MANYREEAVVGTSWRRPTSMALDNPFDTAIPKTLAYNEEDVMDLGEAGIMRSPAGMLQVPYVPNERIDLRDAGGNLTGESVFQSDLYTILYSLYYQKAEERDAMQSTRKLP